MKHRKFSDIAGEISPERRACIDAIKKKARADAAGCVPEAHLYAETEPIYQDN